MKPFATCISSLLERERRHEEGACRIGARKDPPAGAARLRNIGEDAGGAGAFLHLGSEARVFDGT